MHLMFQISSFENKENILKICLHCKKTNKKKQQKKKLTFACTSLKYVLIGRV